MTIGLTDLGASLHESLEICKGQDKREILYTQIAYLST